MKFSALLLLQIAAPFIHASAQADASADLNDLLGSWQCISSEWNDPYSVREDVAPYYYPTPGTIVFEKDSLHGFNYPCEIVNSYRIAVRNDSLVILGTERPVMLPEGQESGGKLRRAGDTIFIETDNAPHYTRRSYIRTVTEAGIVRLLKSSAVNPSCFEGTWELVKTFDTRYDGNGIVPIRFPFTLPSMLHIKAPVSSKLGNDRKIYLHANGSVRLFHIVSFSGGNTMLDLRPGRWYKGHEITITYVLQQEEESPE